jgi:predicted negative regulator of RcsB-dependent stress response
MAEYSSDEERFSALVNFFKDNKNTFLIIFIVASVFLISSLSFKSYTLSQNSKAAKLYDEWYSSQVSETSIEADDVKNFNLLQENYTNTGYAQLARMIRGSFLAKEGQLDNALEDFHELLRVSSGIFGNEMLNSIARINIARIELSQNNFSSALEVLESFSSNTEHPLVYEVRGDALIGLEKDSLALDQYSLALQNTQNESEQSILKMKINKLNN